MDKELKDKAIDIKGKEYILVKDRILFFNETYPTGSITTELLSEPSSDKIVIKATVTIEGDTSTGKAQFTGHSQATVGDGYINKTSALENAETSAVGRALAMMGIGVIESIASADEINKATGTEGKPTNSDLVCSTCGAKGKISYRKNKNGTVYCPNFLTHKQKGEEFAMVVDKPQKEAEIQFEADMPAEK